MDKALAESAMVLYRETVHTMVLSPDLFCAKTIQNDQRCHMLTKHLRIQPPAPHNVRPTNRMNLR